MNVLPAGSGGFFYAFFYVDSVKRIVMTMQEFTQLNEIEQMSAIMQFGKLMAEDTEVEKRTFLYRLESFYVTAVYLQDGDQLCEINCFLQVSQLVPHNRRQLLMTNPAERTF